MANNGKISGIGNATARINEITPEDVAIIRSYIFGFNGGVLDVQVEKFNINEVTQVRFTFSDGHLIATYPDNYQGTEFERRDNKLIASTDDLLKNLILVRKKGLLKVIEE